MICTFHEGDRVRLGALRGGIVVRQDGKLRVRFPNSQRLLWLDHMVPDEGPDGRVYPNTWASCERCGNPTPEEVCINCRREPAPARPKVRSPQGTYSLNHCADCRRYRWVYFDDPDGAGKRYICGGCFKENARRTA